MKQIRFLVIIICMIIFGYQSVGAESLAWDHPGGADGFIVYWNESGDTDEPYHINDITSPWDITPMNLEPGITYEIWLYAYNSAGLSDPSNIVSHTPITYTPPDDNPKTTTINIPETVQQLILNFN